MSFFKVPERERRAFKYKPRYYNPDCLKEEPKSEEEAMRERIRQSFQRESKHHRIPSSRLWVFVAILLLLLLMMSRL